MVGERQTQRLREAYVRAILSQEIGWFDAVGSAGLAPGVMELTAKVQGNLQHANFPSSSQLNE
jgi:hypothetical protein